MKLNELGKKIQVAREEQKMSQEQLAIAIGCSQSAISNYEKGKRRIYLSQLERLSEVLDKPLDYFVESSTDHPSATGPKDYRLLEIINNLYHLTNDEVAQVDKFIQYLKWLRSRGGEKDGPFLK